MKFNLYPKWWHFWNPFSGFSGSMLFFIIKMLAILILLPFAGLWTLVIPLFGISYVFITAFVAYKQVLR